MNWASKHKKAIFGGGLIALLLVARLLGAPIPVEPLIAPILTLFADDLVDDGPVDDDTADDDTADDDATVEPVPPIQAGFGADDRIAPLLVVAVLLLALWLTRFGAWR